MFSLKESTSNKERFFPCSMTRGTNSEIIPITIPVKIPIVRMDAVVFFNFNLLVKKFTKGLPINETTAAIIKYDIKIWISFNRKNPMQIDVKIAIDLNIPFEISL